MGSLGDMSLGPDESAIKVARRVHDGTIHTLIGLYHSAGGYGSTRGGAVMGAGFCLTGTETIHGRAALAYLVDALQAFLDTCATEGRLTSRLRAISPAILPEPASARALKANLFEPTPDSGLATRSGSGPGGVLFFGLAGPGEREAIADYLDACQVDPRFSGYHTLLIGDARDPFDQRLSSSGSEMVSAAEFLNRRIARSEPPAPDLIADMDSSRASWRTHLGDTETPRERGQFTRVYRRGAAGAPAPRARHAGKSGFYLGFLCGVVATALLAVMTTYLFMTRIDATARQASEIRSEPPSEMGGDGIDPAVPHAGEATLRPKGGHSAPPIESRGDDHARDPVVK